MTDDAGYRQALENYIYHVEGLSKRLEEHSPDDPFAAIAEFMGRGPIFQEMEEEITKLDKIFEVIGTTYGKTPAELDADISTIVAENAIASLLLH